jgi:hypothetical protein
MVPATEVNTIPCGGVDNTGDGCQEVFPRSDGSNCHKCKRIHAAKNEEERQALIKVIFSVYSLVHVLMLPVFSRVFFSAVSVACAEPPSATHVEVVNASVHLLPLVLDWYLRLTALF